MDNFDEIFYYKPDVLVDILDEAIANCSRAKDLLELAAEEEKKENTAKEKRIEELKQEIAPALELALKIQSKKFCSLLRSGKTDIGRDSICDIFKNAVESVKDEVGTNRVWLECSGRWGYRVPQKLCVLSYTDFSFLCEEDIPTFRYFVEKLECFEADYCFKPISNRSFSPSTNLLNRDVLKLIDNPKDEDNYFRLNLHIYISSFLFPSSDQYICKHCSVEETLTEFEYLKQKISGHEDMIEISSYKNSLINEWVGIITEEEEE